MTNSQKVHDPYHDPTSTPLLISPVRSRGGGRDYKLHRNQRQSGEGHGGLDHDEIRSPYFETGPSPVGLFLVVKEDVDGRTTYTRT